jgi:hypothetical protein
MGASTMTLLNLPYPVAKFVEAMHQRNAGTLLKLFTPDAVVKVHALRHRVQPAKDWVDQNGTDSGTDVRPINGAREGGKFILTVLADGDRSELPVLVACQFDWSFSIADGRIAQLEIAPTGALPLAPTVADFVNATNACSLNELVAIFAEDAIVNDQLQEHWGKVAIGEWAESEIIADRVTIFVVSAIEHHGRSIVTANVDGDFDKRGLPEPLVLTFYFSSEDGKITQLIILRNVPSL